MFPDGFQKELDGFNWMIGLKKRGFSWISDRTSWFFSFPKKEKLIDTGFFFLLVFQDCGLVTYWTAWFSWILNDCLTNQLLTQKYTVVNLCTIADLLFFNFMVITEQLVNHRNEI